jgi:deleted-in-malignant-brain-tumors protein 1
VVCRQLGYLAVENVTTNSFYGYVPAVFAFDNVNCTGNESAVTACAHLNVDDCSANEGAGVVCSTETAEG